MKIISGHEFGGAGELLEIKATDEKGQGGAHHVYDIVSTTAGQFLGRVEFQNGPVKEADVNGVTEGALLAIVADRLREFQSGPYSCRTNALALTKIEEALHWLESRTRDRVARGVEGTSKK